jgi:hypothetical protein
MQIKNRSFSFILITIFILIFYVNGQSNAGTSIIDAGIKFPDGSVQTTKAVETGVPGPAGPIGGFKLYDANNVYIGYIIDSATVYRPDIPGFFKYMVAQGGLAVQVYSMLDLSNYRIFFSSNNCTGTPYLYIFKFYVYELTIAGNTNHYIFDTSLPVIHNNQQINSFWRFDAESCVEGRNVMMSDYYPLKTIDFPLSGISLQYPPSIRNQE